MDRYKEAQKNFAETIGLKPLVTFDFQTPHEVQNKRRGPLTYKTGNLALLSKETLAKLFRFGPTGWTGGRPSYRFAKRSMLSLMIGIILPLTVGEKVLANILRHWGPDIVAQIESFHGIALQDKAGTTGVLQSATKPTTVSVKYTGPLEDIQFYTEFFPFVEDRTLGQNNRLRRFLGTDIPAVGKAGFSWISGRNTRGGSTSDQMVCSRLYNSYVSGGSLHVRGKEAICGMQINAQLDGQFEPLIRMAADNHPVARGAELSNWGQPVHGIVLGARVLFSKDVGSLRRCEVAVIVAAHQRSVLIPGPNSDLTAASEQWRKITERAQIILRAFNAQRGDNPNADDACFESLSEPWATGEVQHPLKFTQIALGSDLSQVKRELNGVQGSTSTSELTYLFADKVKQRQAAAKALCKIDRTKSLLMPICPNPQLSDANARIFVMDRMGRLVVSQSFGPGSFNAINEPEGGQNLSRGSIGKGLVVAAIGNGNFCRRTRNGIHDPNGSLGVSDAECRAGRGHVGLAAIITESLNLAAIEGLDNLDVDFRENYLNTLGYTPDTNIEQIILGTHSLSLQELLAGYGALTELIAGGEAIGPFPHVTGGRPVRRLDLSAFLRNGPAIQKLFSGPLQKGTARLFGQEMRKRGYVVLTAKTGTSEAGSGNHERGKHIAGTLRLRDGQLYTYYVELASSDSAALSTSGVLNTGDLARLLAATLDNTTL